MHNFDMLQPVLLLPQSSEWEADILVVKILPTLMTASTAKAVRAPTTAAAVIRNSSLTANLSWPNLESRLSIYPKHPSISTNTVA